MLKWSESDYGLRATGRILDYRIGERHSQPACFTAHRTVPNKCLPTLDEAKAWCEQVEAEAPKRRRLKWEQISDRHWSGERRRGLHLRRPGDEYHILHYVQPSGTPDAYGVVTHPLLWHRPDYVWETLAEAKDQCEQMDIAPKLEPDRALRTPPPEENRGDWPQHDGARERLRSEFDRARAKLPCEYCGASEEPALMKPARESAEWWNDPSVYIGCSDCAACLVYLMDSAPPELMVDRGKEGETFIWAIRPED